MRTAYWIPGLSGSVVIDNALRDLVLLRRR